MEKNIGKIEDIKSLYSSSTVISDIEYRKSLFDLNFLTQSLIIEVGSYLKDNTPIEMKTAMQLFAGIMPLSWTIHAINDKTTTENRPLSLEQNRDGTYKNQLALIRKDDHFMLMAIDNKNKRIICFDPAGDFAKRFKVESSDGTRISRTNLANSALFKNNPEFLKQIQNYQILDVCSATRKTYENVAVVVATNIVPQDIKKDKISCGIHCLGFGKLLVTNNSNNIDGIAQIVGALKNEVKIEDARNYYANSLDKMKNKVDEMEQDDIQLELQFKSLKFSERNIHRSNTYPLGGIKEVSDSLEQSPLNPLLEDRNSISSKYLPKINISEYGKNKKEMMREYCAENKIVDKMIKCEKIIIAASSSSVSNEKKSEVIDVIKSTINENADGVFKYATKISDKNNILRKDLLQFILDVVEVEAKKISKNEKTISEICNKFKINLREFEELESDPKSKSARFDKNFHENKPLSITNPELSKPLQEKDKFLKK